MKKKGKNLHNKAFVKATFYDNQENKNKYKKSSISKHRINKRINIKKNISIEAIVIIIFFVVVIIFAYVEEKDKDKIFKGKEYFAYLGISKTDQFEESLYEVDELREVDNIAVGKYYYDGETYYRFQVKKDGKSAYDNEITDYQGEIQPSVDENKSKVAVYKRIYTKSNGSKVSMFYYRLMVPNNKIKMVS